MLVIDANVVVDLCMSKAGFDALADHELVAPPLLRAEALSVLHVMHWRRVVSSHVIDTALERLGSAPIRFTDPRDLAREAWRVAEEFGWKKTYDAEYVALAQLLDWPTPHPRQTPAARRQTPRLCHRPQRPLTAHPSGR